MNVYQELVKRLKEVQASTESIRYASDHAFDLRALHESGKSIDELAGICMYTRSL